MLFEQLATLPSYEMTRENLAKIEADAAIS